MKYLLCSVTSIILTATAMTQQPILIEASFNHMAFPVKNLQASVDFYKSVFQLEEITNRTKNDNIRWLSMRDGKELHLISNQYPPVVANKAVHLAFTTKQIDALANNLKQMKIPFSDWAGTPNVMAPRADGVLQLYLQDPDGYWIEVNNGYAGSPNENAIKDVLWKMEEDYWVYVKNKDYRNYLTLWDENFMGYPSTNVIGTKATITDWIKEMYKTPGRQFDYKLTRQGENVFGDIAMVFYDATMIWSNDKGEIIERTDYKLTHTWRRTGKGWLIIGGMGAKK